MSLRPAYRLVIGGRTVDTTSDPRASTLVGLQVSLGLGAPADAATLVLAQVGGLRPRQGDDAAVELGYADGDGGLERVITGTVSSVEAGITTSRVTVEGGLGAMLRTFVDETFEGKKAGEIVRDLAGRGGAQVARVDDGPKFPAYVVDGRRSLLRHVRDLAALAGFDAYADEEGKLVFRRFQNGNTVHVLKRGRDLISLDLRRGGAAAGAVDAFGESPTGSQGAESWGWLTADGSRSKGSAGSGAKRLLELPVLRTADTTAAAARAALAELTRAAVRGEAVLAGRPQVRLGDAVRLEDTGAADADGTYQVRGVVHRLSKAAGFTTTVGFRSMG
jgi:phage protein D